MTAEPVPVEKPRIRVRAGTRDTFQNFATRTGVGADNVFSQGGYGFTFKTLDRVQLEAAYRGNWVVGQAVDVVAEDMTRAGISIDSGMDPTQSDDIYRALEELCIWPAIQSCIKWSRLYGGSIGVMMIDGQNTATPLDEERVGPDQFRGIMPVDRWMLWPRVDQPIMDFGPDYGRPEFYELVAPQPGMPTMRIHHTRVIRFEGMEVPMWQRRMQNGWGMSVVERMFDRLLAFDSGTMGAAQLVHKAHLRTYAVEGLRDLIAAGGEMMENLAAQIDLIRLYQSNEGMTLMDAKDRLEAHSYAFNGLPETIMIFAQQLSGAVQIPLVRLLGQSPAGLNATGDADIRLYYDTISAGQSKDLRGGLTKVIALAYRSKFGRALPPGFGFSFNPLWQMSATEKADVAEKKTRTVSAAHQDGVISDQTYLRELRSISRETGVWSSITDEEINAADDEPPDPSELLGEAGQGAPPGAEVKEPADA